ncbi:MAG: cytochrome b/b6 domain-containing protein [Steroidobacteraceae bacterium]
MTYSTRRVWDIPTRLFHWLTVVLLALSWWTAENHNLEFHRYSGYALLGLLCFRLYWGFFGSTTARFAHFLRGPSRTLRYVRKLFAREHQPAAPGHNPLGAWSVLILLLLVGAQIGLGLFAVDVDGIESGPLSAVVSFDTGRRCAELHESVFNALLIFSALHVLAVLFYWIVPRRNLIASMIHGKARADEVIDEPLMFASFSRAVIGVLLAVAIVWLVVRLE